VVLGAFFAPQKTGLSAPIFAPAGQKFRFYPLRSQIAARFALGVSLRETPGMGLRGAVWPFGVFAKRKLQPASMPFLSFRFLQSKNLKICIAVISPCGAVLQGN
jgi:hypothetical protein